MPLNQRLCGHESDHGMSDLLRQMYPEKIFDEKTPCRRQIWENTGSCILHAKADQKPTHEVSEALRQGENLNDLYLRNIKIYDVKIVDEPIVNADFHGATLNDVEFVNCEFYEVDFSTTIMSKVGFPDSNLRFASFRGAICHGTTFRDAYLPETRFDGTDLRNAIFQQANVESSTFDGANIRGADFNGAALYQTSFRDARIDDDTEFGRRTWYEGRRHAQYFMHDHRDPNEDPIERAAWQYRMLSRLYQANSRPMESRKYYLEGKDRRRVLYRRKWNIVSYLTAELSRWTSRYGESPWRVVGTSIVVILGSAVLYPEVGGVTELVNVGGSGLVSEWLGRLYFSVVTFTTLGFGDIHPATRGAQMIAGIEAFLGALLMALLVFVLGRRTTW